MFHSSEFLLDPAPSVAEHLDPRRVFAETDGKINPGPPAQRLMKPPLSRYIALAQRRTNGAYVASRAIIGKNHFHGATGVQSERHDPDVLPVRAAWILRRRQQGGANLQSNCYSV